MNQALMRLSAAVVAAFICFDSFCTSVSLAWDANAEPDITGYRVYYSRLLSAAEVVDVGAENSVTITNLMGGSSYQFYATAYTSNGWESAPSNVVEYLVPGLPVPGNLGPVQITKVSMEGDALAIIFPTVLGVLYLVEADDNFPSDNWNPVASGILGTGLAVTITDSLWNSAPRRIYRIAATPSF